MATVGGRGQRLVLPAAVGRPTTASAAQQAVGVVYLALCYWAVDLLGCLGDAERGATWRRAS